MSTCMIVAEMFDLATTTLLTASLYACVLMTCIMLLTIVGIWYGVCSVHHDVNQEDACLRRPKRLLHGIWPVVKYSSIVVTIVFLIIAALSL